MRIKEITEVLPHCKPFIQVDEILGMQDDRFSTAKYFCEEEKQFYYDGHNEEISYPKILLIEHAAQTMFLHGYHMGIEKNWWDYDYKPMGFTTGIENFEFRDVDIKPSDKIVTVTQPIKIIKNMGFFLVNVEVFVNETLICSGRISGMFSDKIERNNSSGSFDNYRSHTPGHPNFLFVDKSKKSFVSTNWFLSGHFPVFPCIPGCLMTHGVLQLIGHDRKIVRIIKVKFNKIALPSYQFKYFYNEVEKNIYDYKISGDDEKEVFQSGLLHIE